MALKDNVKQIGKNKNFCQSLMHALQGIWALVTEERNFRFHILASAFAFMLGIFLKININDWLWIVTAIFLVIAAEVLNTIVETVVDLIVDNHYSILAKKAKDVAAGGVLISALFAIIIGCLIFIPSFLKLIR
ncbi:diacylglycerol kinase family protein [Apilactobacillus xinyiensis]|uniref:Diacylglycerol kinase family protein n=1 Tax=Apilactobacillus xinyiensis TaxID=2841032 RepID=A0ABT0HZQ7_9LACO|nr:diacylglycerol kinase family protein [Apilactobacillus xinyiensis]MCK8624062.1 diacylglycerol kinase family protein [Apilactobacillus xinyiensis]MCL0311654.1 diacylglycerol kinase family protein [Apilactobacillus xinyiensis]MCL0318201.1 diacylglycerol kinase family protein [Apilactobacillus xinyiensis]